MLHLPFGVQHGLMPQQPVATVVPPSPTVPPPPAPPPPPPPPLPPQRPPPPALFMSSGSTDAEKGGGSIEEKIDQLASECTAVLSDLSQTLEAQAVFLCGQKDVHNAHVDQYVKSTMDRLNAWAVIAKAQVQAAYSPSLIDVQHNRKVVEHWKQEVNKRSRRNRAKKGSDDNSEVFDKEYREPNQNLYECKNKDKTTSSLMTQKDSQEKARKDKNGHNMHNVICVRKANVNPHGNNDAKSENKQSKSETMKTGKDKKTQVDKEVPKIPSKPQPQTQPQIQPQSQPKSTLHGAYTYTDALKRTINVQSTLPTNSSAGKEAVTESQVKESLLRDTKEHMHSAIHNNQEKEIAQNSTGEERNSTSCEQSSDEEPKQRIPPKKSPHKEQCEPADGEECSDPAELVLYHLQQILHRAQEVRKAECNRILPIFQMLFEPIQNNFGGLFFKGYVSSLPKARHSLDDSHQTYCSANQGGPVVNGIANRPKLSQIKSLSEDSTFDMMRHLQTKTKPDDPLSLGSHRKQEFYGDADEEDLQVWKPGRKGRLNSYPSSFQPSTIPECALPRNDYSSFVLDQHQMKVNHDNMGWYYQDDSKQQDPQELTQQGLTDAETESKSNPSWRRQHHGAITNSRRHKSYSECDAVSTSVSSGEGQAVRSSTRSSSVSLSHFGWEEDAVQNAAHSRKGDKQKK